MEQIIVGNARSYLASIGAIDLDLESVQDRIEDIAAQENIVRQQYHNLHHENQISEQLHQTAHNLAEQ